MLSQLEGTPNVYRRVITTLNGEKPTRYPFVDRLELWYSHHLRADTLPDRYQEVPPFWSPQIISTFTVPVPDDFEGWRLTDIHRDIGMGQQIQMIAYGRKLNDVEITLELNGEVHFQETNPIIDYFPRLFNKMERDRPGDTVATISTPVGKLTTVSTLSSEMIAAGAIPLMKDHPIKDVTDFKVVEYIFEHSDFVPRFKEIKEIQDSMGEIGFVIPMINRIPFQQLALDFVGEVPFFYMMYDHPAEVERMLNLFDEVLLDDLSHLNEFSWVYLQFDDNLDGVVTNPKLFAEYCLPYYQRYTDILHTQGKKVGSHTDGNLKQLLLLLLESGLDVCESFTPAPLTDCTFDEAWDAWSEKGPIIWGGIPSTVLEMDTSESEFRGYIDHILDVVAGGPIIFGIGDMVMPNSLLERVKFIAEVIEEHELDK